MTRAGSTLPRAVVGSAVAVASVAAAAALTSALWPFVKPTATPLFFAAVVISSWFGGTGPGLLATVLSVLVTEMHFLPPWLGFDMASAVRITSFVIVALLVASLYDRARTAQRRAEGLASAREELLRQEQSARADAETASRAKDEFLATLSHELRTPLNAMLGWLWWIRQGKLEPDRHARAMDTIDRNCKALAQRIEDLLDVSRIITGKLRLAITPVALAPIVEAAVDVVRPAADAKAIDLVVSLGDVPAVAGDADRLQQIMWNLLSNAIKFTPDKGRVDVRLAEGEHGAVVTVADTGRGITADVLPHIFERFRQSDTTATTPGLGLGLSIVRHLVETHGGTIEAASAGAGQGATFVVTLPLGGGLAETPAKPAPAAGAASLLGLRVLIVDDDRDTRRLLAATLGDMGAVVSTVGSTREAMESFVRDTPDVIVSDIRLPGEDGYAFIRKVRALPPERGGRTPAVAVTAYPRAEDRVRALEAGFQMHVAKPVPPHELAAVVAAVAGRTGAR
ncbi:MAG TPA: ATP-binding protein [Candidatus Limnocylindria bacterium]|nr:ATP-binding protein [Candidatus Limnocylindria bacterium]